MGAEALTCTWKVRVPVAPGASEAKYQSIIVPEIVVDVAAGAELAEPGT
jgi:hypothetical protein